MTILTPLDPFSEVVDERRRWTPPWYSWLKQVSEAVPPPVVPVTSTDNAIARFNGTTGTVQDSDIQIDDSGNLLLTGNTAISWDGTVFVTRSGSTLNFSGASSGYNFDAVVETPRLKFDQMGPFDLGSGFLGANSLGTNILWDMTSITVAAGKFYYLARASLDSGDFIPVTIGASNAVCAGYGTYLKSTGSDASSALYGWIGTVALAGPGNAKCVYGRASAQAGSVGGVVVGLVGGVDGHADQVGSGGAAWACQLDYSTGPDDLGVHIALDSSTGKRLSAGITPIQKIAYNGPAYRAWMDTSASSSGARAYQLLDGSVGNAETYYVKKDGEVFSKTALNAGVDETNGTRITTAAVTRTAAAGNLSIVAGTDAGTKVVMQASGVNYEQVFSDRIEIGVTASALGKTRYFNMTSGFIDLQPVAGALGSTVLQLPATSGTLMVAPAPIVTTDNAIARYDGTAGALQNSGVSIDDSNNLLLPSGAVINWNSGDVTITHSANALTFGGGSSGYSFDAAVTALTLTVTNGQVAFPATQVPSSDANTLDDYEEGTFTPVLTFGGGSTGITYSTQTGKYTKIGNLVTGWINIILTSKGSSTGVVNITGLPFTSAADATATIQGNNLAASVATTIHALVGNGGTVIGINRFAAGTGTQMNDTDFNNNSVLRVTFVYPV